jgi:hypothetical protein
VWWPIFNYADGYGLTYGIRPAFTDPIGQDSRLSFPLSWGGERRAGLELERSFNDQRTRAGVAFWVNRRVNPFFDVPDIRQQVRFEADHAIVPWMRVGGSARIAQVEFGDSGAPTRYDARHVVGGPHVTFDTRIDPLFPRNAIYTHGWEVARSETGSAGRWTTDARGVGIRTPDRRSAFARTAPAIGRALRERLRQSLLGGGNSCVAIGPDIAPATAWRRSRRRCASAQLAARVEVGVKATIDAGTPVELRDEPLAMNQRSAPGIGGGVEVNAAVEELDLDIAWPGGRQTTHVHFAMRISF